MAGPFARIIVQLVVVAGSALGRHLSQAWKESVKSGTIGRGAIALRRRMTTEEACKILEVDKSSLTRTLLEKRFDTMHSINAPSEQFAGSPYLQQKIRSAHTVIMQDIGRSIDKDQGSGGSGDSGAPDR
eukprot:GHVU01066584.1.p4 GENE.GHVU01066584.1~~GHVU01066584.1.p4  ORF type:complete len:129 (-),score=24.77 GHVU01066584.1:1000-1386(-)